MPIQKLGSDSPASASVMQTVSIQPLGRQAGDDAERAAQQHADQEASDGELQRVGELGSDQAGHRLAAAKAVAEIAAHGIGQERDVLPANGRSRPSLGARRIHRLHR